MVLVPGVEAARDLAYRSDDSGPNLVDVYFPTAIEGGPVVVFLHGASPVDKSSPIYPWAVQGIVSAGAVVFMPNWDAAVQVEPDGVLQALDGLGCAVSYALAHAAEYGADPDRLVLAGHSGGAVAAAMTGLREANSIADCSVAMAPYQVDGMVLWDGDWMLAHPVNDSRDNLIEHLEVAVPWSWLADGPRMPVTLVTAAGSRSELKRCDVSDPDSSFWVRDPDGWFRVQLDAIRALDDGCIDVWEPTVLLAATMRDSGYDVTELLLETSHYGGHLSEEDRQTLVDEFLTIADR